MSFKHSIAFLAATTLASAPVSAATVQIAVQGPVIELGVTQTVYSPSTYATVSAGVVTRAPTAVEAMRQNTQQMAAVIDRIKALGVKPGDIQTSRVSLQAAYEYRAGQPPAFKGYDAMNTVAVKLRDVSKIGPTLDALVEAGANQIGGPSFGLDDDKPAKAEARKRAFADAEVRGRELAALAGYRDVRLLEVSENYSTYSAMSAPPPPVAAYSVSGAVRMPPIEPGQVGTSATLVVKYEMIR